MTAPERTVFVVDDDAGTRDSLRTLLAAHHLPTRTYASAEAFLDDDDLEGGCLLLDLNMPGMTGEELQRHLDERGVSMPIIFLSGQADIPVVVRTMRRGAVTFLTKPFDTQELISHVRGALKVGAERRLQRSGEADALARLDRVSPRERDVLDLVLQGDPNKTIAFKLGISNRTVEKHRAKIMQKTGADSLPALTRIVELARRAGSGGTSSSTGALEG